MRNNDPIFFPTDSVDLALRQTMQKNYSDSINILQTQWYQADLDQRFCLGDQDIWGLIFPGVSSFRRKIFNFNLINSHVQMVTGYQRRNRKSTQVYPLKDGLSKTADQLNKCLDYVHSQSGAYQLYSDAFEQGALIQGLGFISIFQDFTNDPVSGDIKMRYVDMKSCIYDPFFRKKDMSDARFFGTRQFFDREEAALLYPQFADEILSLPRGTYRDDKYYFMPEVYQIQFPNLIAFDEYWYLTSRKALYLVDVETNETQEFQGDEEDLKAIKNAFKDRLKVIEKTKPTVRRSIVVNERVMVDEPNPYHIDSYPYVPMLGYFSPDSPYYSYKFRGLVRDLRDAQYLFNRRKVSDLDILESQQQGLKVKKGALVTPEDSLNQGNGRVLSIDPKFQMDDVQPMPIIPPAPTMIQMEEMLSNVMNQISGVNETMIGTNVDDKAGIITMMRTSAGITTLTRLFDQFDESQTRCGEIILQMIQKQWTYGKVRQVIGEEPTAEFDNKAFLKYGCKVAQGVLTESQQQLQLQTMLYLKEKQLVDFSPREILEATNIPNKEKFIQRMEQQEQAANEQQQQMSQLQMQQLQVDNETKLAYAESQKGLAQERIAKIQLDQALNAERINRAEEDKTSAALNVIKALKELQGMDLSMLQQGLEILNTIEGKNEQEKNLQQTQNIRGVT
jgi:hypothetical protein